MHWFTRCVHTTDAALQREQQQADRVNHACNRRKLHAGEFVVPEPGLYLFLVTCCTFDMKKCLLSIRKNGKDVAMCFDQDGDTNKVKSGG